MFNKLRLTSIYVYLIYIYFFREKELNHVSSSSPRFSSFFPSIFIFFIFDNQFYLQILPSSFCTNCFSAAFIPAIQNFIPTCKVIWHYTYFFFQPSHVYLFRFLNILFVFQLRPV